jgi:hypothetical protein
MRAAAALVVLGVLVAAGGLLASWLWGGDDGGGAFAGDVRIISPQTRTVVTSPVEVVVESLTYRIADAADREPGAAHYVLFLDQRPFTAAGQVVPRDEEGFYHFSTDTLELDLTPGEHSLVLGLADNQDVRVPEATVFGITITVE